MNIFKIIKTLRTELTGEYNFEQKQQSNTDKLYYINLTDIINREVKLLSQGVPVIKDKITKTVYHNPVTISFYALYLWDSIKSGNHQISAYDDFILLADWLKDNNFDGAWVYPIYVKRYSVEPGWKSAMAQGLAISVLIRAFKHTHNPDYLDTALKAALLLTKPIDEGGCASFNEDGQPFLEEIAVNPTTQILNGNIFALWGLCDLEQFSNKYTAHRNRVIKRLALELPNYDLGYWSRYDLFYNAPASRGYHTLHVTQLKSLYLSTGEPAFQHYAEMWSNYLKDSYKKTKAFMHKGMFEVKRGFK